LAGVFSFESYDSNFGRSAFSRDRSDPAAYAKHYAYLQFKKVYILDQKKMKVLLKHLFGGKSKLEKKYTVVVIPSYKRNINR